MEKMEWQPNKKIVCPQCLKNGITSDMGEGYIDHNGVSCQFPSQKWLIQMVGQTKQEITLFYKQRLEKFSSEAKKKWLHEVEIKDQSRIEHAKQEAEALFEQLKDRGTHWEINQKENIYRGFLAEEWATMMLEDMKIREVKHAVETDKAAYDILIRPCGTFEVKTSPIGRDYVNIKKYAWQSAPCLYLIAVKTINIQQPTFKLLGYMTAYAVYKLKVQAGFRGMDYYRAEPKNLKTPNQLLDMLLKHSTEKPDWM